MKANQGHTRRRNSKRGIALSTAMAICIVLALLMAILVSMATLNITTTQSTISQRESYIQAKSAIAFAESYYVKNPDEIPGNSDGDTGGEALIVFKDNVIAHGANIYIISTSSNPSLVDATTVENLKKNAVDTYVEVKNTGAVVDFTAYCKYDIVTNGMGKITDYDAYNLSKQFEYDTSDQKAAVTYTGNILFDTNVTGDGWGINVHVRTNPAFVSVSEPYLYIYTTQVNPKATEETANDVTKDYPFGGSSAVNKLGTWKEKKKVGEDWVVENEDKSAWGQTKLFTGKWDGVPSSNGAMTYEGNGWYVTSLTGSASEGRYTYVNAIVTRQGSNRHDFGDGQSWEIFGIPVPSAGDTNDVYITLNQSKLHDARQVLSTSGGDWVSPANTHYESSDRKDKDDEMNWLFKEAGYSIDKFAQFCSEWYTIYTKQVSAIAHYKYAGETGNGTVPSGFTYEGYGWSRSVSHSFSGTFKSPKGQTYWYGDGAANIVNKDTYGNPMVTEMFVVEGTDSSNNFISGVFGDENAANEWLVTQCGDSTAPDYITINVKSSQMPVSGAVTTTIDYSANIINTTADPTPPADPGSGDPDPSPASNNFDELEFENLVKVPTGKSGDGYSDIANWGVAGDFPGNNWARGDVSGDPPKRYELLNKTTSNGYIHEYTYTDLPGGTYMYKFVSMDSDNGELSNSAIWVGDPTSPNSDHNAIVTVPEGYKLTVRFDRQSGTILDPILTDQYGTVVVEPSGNKYRMFCDSNNWGRDATATDGPHYYEKAYEMQLQPDNKTFVYELVTKGNRTENLRIIKEVAGHEGPDSTGWAGNAWPSENYVINVGGNSMDTYTVKVYFDEGSKNVWNDDPQPVTNVSSDKFYVIGSFNDWGERSGIAALTYEGATYGDQYFMGSTPTISGDIATYKLDIGKQYSGDITLKIIATDGTQSGEIDWEKSWGAKNGEGISAGADKEDFTFTVPGETSAYYVTIQFDYNLTDPTKSSIYYILNDIPDVVDVAKVQVGFHNAQLKNVNEPHDETAFTTPWDTIYVNYLSPRGFEKDVPFKTTNASNNICWDEIPSDAYDLYFSNKEFKYKGDPDYEYTEKLPASRISANQIYVPTTYTEDSSHNKCWSFGEENYYRTHVNSITAYHTEANTQMNHVGSYQVNYYNAPLVNILDEINHNAGNSGKYAYAAYPYTSDKMKVDGNVCNFDRKKYITYQGEVYFYIGSPTGYSFLICQGEDKKYGGILKENELALESTLWRGQWDGNKEYGSDWKMSNRQGATFTSSGTYFNHTPSVHSYNDYTPNWYTIKLPVSDEFTIENVTGVVSSGHEVIKNNSMKTKVAKAGDYLNRPVYIYYDPNASGDKKNKFFTYDTNFGNVDTNGNGQVSVYFNKPGDWSNNVKVDAYGVMTGENTGISQDTTDGDHSYYIFTFDEGKYCFFRFYDGDDPAKTTEVLTLTGEENDDRQYKILCNAASGNMSSFEYYLHPRTAALYAWQEARSANVGSKLTQRYSYSAGEYTPNDSNSMPGLASLESSAESAYGGGTKSKYYGSSVNDYRSRAIAAKNFTSTMRKVRTYIAADPNTTDPNELLYLYPERSNKLGVLIYTQRWIGILRKAHDDAYNAIYFNGGDSEASLNYWTAYLNQIIAKPEFELNPNAIQIVVDNQVVTTEEKDPSDPTKTVKKTSGGWDIGKIRLYVNTATGIKETNAKLYKTTQSSQGFYAYVFMADEFESMNFNVGQVIDVPDDTHTLVAGSSYIFKTATKEFKDDDDGKLITFAGNEIKENDPYTKAYGEFSSKTAGEKFSVMFQYDTTVTYGTPQKSYKIMAGCYTISSSYSGFRNDLSGGNTGINLFSDRAKNYFSNPKICGLTASGTSIPGYASYGDGISGGGDDIDIVANEFSSSSQYDFATDETTGRINFRWNNIQDPTQGTLTMNQDINMKAGIVTIAANYIKLNGHEFHIDAKKVTFYCDTVVDTGHGKQTIDHGTYIFNTVDGSSTLTPINLSSSGSADDWRTHYLLVEEVKSDLGGGKYVAK